MGPGKEKVSKRDSEGLFGVKPFCWAPFFFSPRAACVARLYMWLSPGSLVYEKRGVVVHPLPVEGRDYIILSPPHLLEEKTTIMGHRVFEETTSTRRENALCREACIF